MQYEQRMIIRFLANHNWGANEIAPRLKENFGQDGYALRMAQGWLVELRWGEKIFMTFIGQATVTGSYRRSNSCFA
jgi:hypothetical protein